MPCFVVLIALFLPRLAIALLYLFTNYLSVYSTVLWPVLGFFFAPYTTLAVAVAYHSAGSISGVYLVLVIIAILVDLGALEGGRRGAGKAPRR